MELKGVLLSHPWGKLGFDSMAACFFAKETRFNLDKGIPYGEFIIGGDKVYETYVVSKDEYINNYFKHLSSEELGAVAWVNFGPHLPFTLKIISVKTPTPLTCFPEQEKATYFHRQNLKKFPSGGVRNQLLIALSDCTLLVGFRELKHIIIVLQKVNELKYLIDESLIKKFLETKETSDFLKLFEDMLDTLPSQVSHAGKLLADRLKTSDPASIGNYHPVKLYLSLFRLYREDVGAFLPYFLNVVRLERMESIQITAGTPYAYLSGDIFECCNNVENRTVGAFSYRKQLNEFIQCLNVKFWTKKDLKNELHLYTRDSQDNIIEFLSPSPSYRVFLGVVGAYQRTKIPKLRTFSIVLVIEGSAMLNDEWYVQPGVALLFLAGEGISFHTLEKTTYLQVTVNFI